MKMDDFAKARQCFRAGSPVIIGREKEKQQLTEFWEQHVKKDQGGRLFLYGIAGTGKTSLVNACIKAPALTV